MNGCRKSFMVAAGDATQDILGTGAKLNFDEPNALQGYGLPSGELTSYRLPRLCALNGGF